MKATEKANLELKKGRKQKKRKNIVKVEVSDDDSESVEQIVLDEPSTPEKSKKNLNTILTLDFLEPIAMIHLLRVQMVNQIYH